MVHTLMLRKTQKKSRSLIEKNHHFLYKISCFYNAFLGTLLNEKYAFSKEKMVKKSAFSLRFLRFFAIFEKSKKIHKYKIFGHFYGGTL